VPSVSRRLLDAGRLALASMDTHIIAGAPHIESARVVLCIMGGYGYGAAVARAGGPMRYVW
jgi:hypothetical protein